MRTTVRNRAIPHIWANTNITVPGSIEVDSQARRKRSNRDKTMTTSKTRRDGDMVVELGFADIKIRFNIVARPV